MNKFIGTAVLGAALAVVGLATNLVLSTQTANAAAPACTIKAKGKTNLQTTEGSSYTVNGNVATIHFDVTGADNCEQLVTQVSWQAPSLSGSPFDQQKIFKVQRTTIKKGLNQTLSIETPTCFYQIDTLRGESPYGDDYSKGYGDRQIGSIHGGTKSCENVKVCDTKTGKIITVSKTDENKYKPEGDIACKPDVKVCNPKTGEIITVKASEASKYKSATDDACKEVKVCDLNSGKIITIKGYQYDSKKYSKDLKNEKCQPKNPEQVNVCDTTTGQIVTVDKDKSTDSKYKPVDDVACNPVPETPETPETPTPEAPEVLPSTGPAEALSALFGTGSLAGAATAYVRSRRALRK